MLTKPAHSQPASTPKFKVNMYISQAMAGVCVNTMRRSFFHYDKIIDVPWPLGSVPSVVPNQVELDQGVCGVGGIIDGSACTVDVRTASEIIEHLMLYQPN